MKRIWLHFSLVAVALVFACSGPPDGGPPPCLPVDPQPATRVVTPPGVVWGFADLHAHPATEVAFGGRFIWGTALDNAAVDATELPEIESCPVETHDRNASSPIDHMVGSLVFPHVTSIAHFPHAPVGDLGFRPSNAWPNARDVIHQQMNLSAIRRAYEGGLRLMFASTTDSQALGALLAGPAMVNGFVPHTNYDYDSAQRQLLLIDKIVELNRNWMGIARSPTDARNIIRGGRLAIVLSLEMDGLFQDQLDRLVDDFGVRHILPVHLIDNDVGGTAANSDIFNASSAQVSEIYRCDRAPLGFMDLSATTAFSHALNWPQTLVSTNPPLYIDVSNIAFPWYQTLGYEPLDYCRGMTAKESTFVQLGQMNARGLCSTEAQCQRGGLPGAARIAHMMKLPLIVDVSHMGYRSVADTLKVSAADGDAAGPPGEQACGGPSPPPANPTPSYPLIASHGDVAHLCPTPPGSCHDSTRSTDPISPASGTERSIDATQARAIIERQGVLGLGVGTDTYGKRAVLDARGGPLLILSPGGATTGCVATPGSDGTPTPGCQPVSSLAAVDTAPDATLRGLEVQTLGGIGALDKSPNTRPFLRIELLGPDGQQSQKRVVLAPFACSTGGCTATVAIGNQDSPVQLDSVGNGPVSYQGRRVTPGSAFCLTAPCPPVSQAPYTLDHLASVSILWEDLACDGSCQQASQTEGADDRCSSNGAPAWTIEQASIVADTDGGMIPLLQVGPYPAPPVARLGSRGSFTLYDRGNRRGVGGDVPATGQLLRISLSSGNEHDLIGASTSQTGANVCVALRQMKSGLCMAAPPPAAGATECPSVDAWVSLNQHGTWAKSSSLYAFARFMGSESEICGIDVAVLDWDPSSNPWTVDEVRIEAVEDPLGHFVRRYADLSNELAGGEMGRLALGTDANGFNGMMDISEGAVPAGALAASACLTTPASNADASQAQPLAPMRIRHSDGSLGDAVLIEERGLATYGQLADMMAIVDGYKGCGHQVHDSLMLSAEATIRAWENIVTPGTWPKKGEEMPTTKFDCGPPPGPAP